MKVNWNIINIEPETLFSSLAAVFEYEVNLSVS